MRNKTCIVKFLLVIYFLKLIYNKVTSFKTLKKIYKFINPYRKKGNNIYIL